MSLYIKSEQSVGNGTPDPPRSLTLRSPKRGERCKGCPYAAVGFICWDNRDDSCLRTEVDRMNRRRRR